MTRPTSPDDIFTLLATPSLLDPVLLVHFDGWIDAGACARVAIDTVVDQSSVIPVASFETEWLLDHRARRPTMHIVDGVNTGLDWPEINLVAGHDATGNDLLVLHGAEPDHNWRTFVDAVVGLGKQFGVRRMIGMGAYPAAAPHTRASRLSVTAATPTLVNLGSSPATLDVPAGAESAIEQGFHRAGIEAVGLWAQVPHYVSGAHYPAASLALVEGLVPAANLRFDTSTLAAEAISARNRLDSLVRNEDSHGEMLAQLERQYDDLLDAESSMPTSDELASEVEKFLRSQDGPTSD